MAKLVFTVETYFPAQRLKIEGWDQIDEEVECGYIAEPYWPEMYEYINITKESGMNRARSAANRRKALEEHLRANGSLLMKVFDGEGFDRLRSAMRALFSSVAIRKPKASRPRSRELYLLARNFNGV